MCPGGADYLCGSFCQLELLGQRHSTAIGTVTFMFPWSANAAILSCAGAGGDTDG